MYFLLEFYKIKQKSEIFANFFLNITIFFFVRVMVMATLICKPLSPDALTAFLSATRHLNLNTSSPFIFFRAREKLQCYLKSFDSN